LKSFHRPNAYVRYLLETGSILVTFDEHFTLVPGLRLWDELAP
jgi:hypothetical protein